MRVSTDSQFLFTGTADANVLSAFKAMEAGGKSLGEVARVNFGKQLRNRKIFVTDVIEGLSRLSELPSGYAAC